MFWKLKENTKYHDNQTPHTFFLYNVKRILCCYFLFLMLHLYMYTYRSQDRNYYSLGWKGDGIVRGTDGFVHPHPSQRINGNGVDRASLIHRFSHTYKELNSGLSMRLHQTSLG